jgi:hypothetical protein
VLDDATEGPLEHVAHLAGRQARQLGERHLVRSELAIDAVSAVAATAPARYRAVVIRLHLVEEYRGRHVVTNGQFYGVQRELITDCRYLEAADARRAIDSDLGIEVNRRSREWYERAMPRADYFSNYKKRAFTCACGWHGRYEGLNKDTLDLAALSCPVCRHVLLFITSPSAEEVRRAAAEGDKDALAMLRQVQAREEAEASWASQALTRASQLPALPGVALVFV